MLLGDVQRIDLAARTVTHTVLVRTTVTPYDSPVVAAGAGQSYPSVASDSHSPPR